jgi:hypothetical protein
MPNHITNKLELIGSIEDIDLLIKRFGTYVPAKISKTHDDALVVCRSVSEEYGFCWLDLKTGRTSSRGDINQIGLPENYEIEIIDAFFCFPDFTKVIPPPNHPAYRDEPSQKEAEASPNWWYTWNVKHWGTKWSGYSFKRPSINQFIFETAWNGVPKIIEAMSYAFPSVTLKYSWADEDTGYNCGKSIYTNGLLQEVKPEGGSREAYEIAFNLDPERSKNYQLIGDKYQYIESEE